MIKQFECAFDLVGLQDWQLRLAGEGGRLSSAFSICHSPQDSLKQHEAKQKRLPKEMINNIKVSK